MKTSSQLFNRRVIMAPMAGVNTPAFCELLKSYGCDFIYTGLLTSHGLVNRNRKTEHILATLPEGITLAGQIFGSRPEVMAEAARVLEGTGRVAVIDVNMGCPAPKVVKSSAGVGLMREPELAGRVVRAVAEAVRLPVTVKMRAGWAEDSINCVELARVCAGEGAAAIALHPRTRARGFSGRADWRLIALLKSAVSVPVIASGDITGPEEAKRCMEETGCDSVMIGRACMGDPSLIGRIMRYLEAGELMPRPDFARRLDDAARHFELHVEAEGEERGAREMRGQLAWYIRGLPGAAAFREAVNRAGSADAVRRLIIDYRRGLEEKKLMSYD